MPRKKRNVPWIDQRGGVYYACWYDPQALRTQRISLRSRDATEAQARFAAFLAEGQEAYAPKVTKGLPVALILEQYYQEHRAGRITGGKFTPVMAHLKRHLGDVQISSVDVPLCRAYVAARGREGAAPGTVRGELSALLTAAKHAVKWRRLPLSDMPSIELPPAPPGRERWLTHTELAALRATAEPGLRDFIDLAYYTASRKTAILTMTKFQIDLAQQRIRLAKPGEAKTKKRRPIVPIAPELLSTVQRLMKGPGATLLPDLGDVNYAFGRACKRAGIAGATPHTLRHTRITHLLQSGAKPWAVAGLAGLTLKTLVDVYGHHCPDYLAEVLNADAETGA